LALWLGRGLEFLNSKNHEGLATPKIQFCARNPVPIDSKKPDLLSK
jgi:hypothetical protein